MICRHKLYHFMVANTRFTAPLMRRGKTKFATIKWYNLCLQIIQLQTRYPLIYSLYRREEVCVIKKELTGDVRREKGRDLTQSYDKIPYTNKNVKRAKWQHKQRHKKFDYTAVVDRLRTVSWSNYGHPTGVVNLVYGPNLPTPRNSRVIRRTHV